MWRKVLPFARLQPLGTDTSAKQPSNASPTPSVFLRWEKPLGCVYRTGVYRPPLAQSRGEQYAALLKESI